MGPSIRKQKDWFDENCNDIKQLLDKKHRLHEAYLSDPKSTSRKDEFKFNTIRRTVQQELHQMQESWLSNKADEVQGHIDRHDMKNFYDTLKQVYGPTLSPLLSADGNTLITEREKILEWWADHFNSILNCPSSINNDTIDRLPQVPISEDSVKHWMTHQPC